MKGKRLIRECSGKIVSLSLSVFMVASASHAGERIVVEKYRQTADSIACPAVPLDIIVEPAHVEPGRVLLPLYKPNNYDMPYSMTANYPDYKRLWLNTGVLFGGGVLALGVLQLLPEDATSWNKKEITSVPLFKRWGQNVSKGPVWDGDNLIFNYVLHPYAGAAYYMGARSLGFNVLYSFLYTTGISTLFWEYGIEAFMEIPSLQDLIITPVAGTIIGESFYLLKRHIVSNGYELFGSRVLGNVVAFIIDPVNEVIGLFAGNPCRDRKAEDGVQVLCSPEIRPEAGSLRLGFTLSCSF